MDILEFSKNMKLKGSNYYLKLAHDTQNPELSGVFTWLAQGGGGQKTFKWLPSSAIYLFGFLCLG